jgi:hypothetical protein
MARQNIGIGAAPNDGTGDTLRVGGDKINDNFIELYLEQITTVTPDISGGTIDLAMTNTEMIFILGNIGVIKTFTFTGSVTTKFNIKIPMTALVALTFPATVVMSDSRWDGTSWTPLETGLYHGTAFFDGTNWALSIPQIPAV